MAAEKGPTQKTRPKKGKPVDIPIPARKEVEDFMRKVAGKPPSADMEPHLSSVQR